VHKVLVGKSEGKRPPGRPRRRWEDRIKCRDWLESRVDPVGSGKGSLVSSYEYGDESSGSGATELVSPSVS
jgi:hypothetical protein